MSQTELDELRNAVSALRKGLDKLSGEIAHIGGTVDNLKNAEFKQLHDELGEIRGTVTAIKKIADTLKSLGIITRWVGRIATVVAPIFGLWYTIRDHIKS